jgi:hypothetical protein
MGELSSMNKFPGRKLNTWTNCDGFSRKVEDANYGSDVP